jgi:hypothetical protein
MHSANYFSVRAVLLLLVGGVLLWFSFTIKGDESSRSFHKMQGTMMGAALVTLFGGIRLWMTTQHYRDSKYRYRGHSPRGLLIPCLLIAGGALLVRWGYPQRDDLRRDRWHETLRASELSAAVKTPDPQAYLTARTQRLGAEEVATLTARYEELRIPTAPDIAPEEWSRRMVERIDEEDQRRRSASGREEMKVFLLALSGLVIFIGGLVLLVGPAYIIIPKQPFRTWFKDV